MNKKSTVLTAVALGLSLGATSAYALKPLYDPPEISWGCELSEKEVINGITAGLFGRGWRIIEQPKDGQMAAQVNVRGKHTLSVDISYTTSSYDITYRDSDNLHFKIKGNGEKQIHKNANSWISNIDNDIGGQLISRCSG